MIEYKTKKELDFLSKNIDLLKDEVLHSKGIILELMKLYAIPYDANALIKDKAIRHYVYRSQLNLEIDEDDESFITPNFVEGVVPHSENTKIELNKVLYRNMFPKKENGSELDDLINWMQSVPYKISISVDTFQTLETDFSLFTSEDEKMTALRKVIMERCTNSLFVKEICNFLNFIQNDVLPQDNYEKLKLQQIILKNLGNSDSDIFSYLLNGEKISEEERELLKSKRIQEENEKDRLGHDYKSARGVRESLSKYIIEKKARGNLRKILENKVFSENACFVESLVHLLKKVKSNPVIEVAKSNQAYKDCLLSLAWNLNQDYPVKRLKKELGFTDKEINESMINQVSKQLRYKGGLSAFHSFIKLTENEDEILRHVLSLEVFNAVASSGHAFNESRDNTDGNIPLEKVIKSSYENLSKKISNKTVTMQDINLFHYMTWMWLPMINLKLKNNFKDYEEKESSFKNCVNKYYLPMIAKLEKDFGKELEFLQFLNTSENIIYLQELNLKDDKAIPENIKFLLEDPVWKNQNDNEVFMKFNEFSKINHQLGYKEIPFNRLQEIEAKVSNFPSRYMVLSLNNNEEMHFLENRYAEIIKAWIGKVKTKCDDKSSNESEREEALKELLGKFEKMGNLFVNINDKNVFLRNVNAVLFNYFPNECEMLRNHPYFQIPENQKIINDNLINIMDNKFLMKNYLSEEKASVFMSVVQEKIKKLKKDGISSNVNAISNCIYYSYKNNAPNFQKYEMLSVIKDSEDVLWNLVTRIAKENKSENYENNLMFMKLLNPELEINTLSLMNDIESVTGNSLVFKVLKTVLAHEKINIFESLPKDEKADFIKLYKKLAGEEGSLAGEIFIDEILFKSSMREAVKNKQTDTLNELLLPLMLGNNYENAEIIKLLKPGLNLLNEENKQWVKLWFYGLLGNGRFSDDESMHFISQVSAKEHPYSAALIKRLNGQQTNLMESEKELIQEFILGSVKEMVNMGYQNCNEELLINYFRYYVDMTPKMLDVIISEADMSKKNSFLKGLLESDTKNISEVKWCLLLELIRNRNDALNPEIMATLEYHRKGGILSDISSQFTSDLGEKFVLIPHELNDNFYKLYDDMSMKLQVQLVDTGKKVVKKF